MLYPLTGNILSTLTRASLRRKLWHQEFVWNPAVVTFPAWCFMALSSETGKFSFSLIFTERGKQGKKKKNQQNQSTATTSAYFQCWSDIYDLEVWHMLNLSTITQLLFRLVSPFFFSHKWYWDKLKKESGKVVFFFCRQGCCSATNLFRRNIEAKSSKTLALFTLIVDRSM